ncbi:ArsR/SmtB family transcription factor [Micromonospora sp. CPCC 206061]|uniref:ArsR/SmtB family transcription factor n=1 Tax=Micromonospora sp. CPCC 206061 TaxID=3122410 RepID=UPI002FF13346
MLRIHFTAEDIGRVRIAREPDPLWETVLSVFRIRRPGPELIFGRWHGHAVRACRRADLDVLQALIRNAYFPDFLTPAEGELGMPAALDALRSTPTHRLRGELTHLARLGGPAPSWMRQLADGDRQARELLADAVRSQYEAVVAPFWTQARAQVDADRARRARVLLDEGSEGLLRSFRPMMCWAPPVLEVDVPYEQSLRLDGRGLLLVPSYLSWGTPDFLHDDSLPPVLVYPVEHDMRHDADARTGVMSLIGYTRALVLETIGDGRTTTDLARLVGVSAGSISQHTAVLREARLIRTTRAGRAVLHTLTPLGTALLDAG